LLRATPANTGIDGSIYPHGKSSIPAASANTSSTRCNHFALQTGQIERNDLLVELNFTTICLSGTIVLIAAVIRGFSGFGFALVGVPLLSMIMPPLSFVPIIFGMQIIAVLPGLKKTLKDAQWKQILPLLPGGFLGTWGGLQLLYRIHPEIIGFVIAIAVIFVAVFLLKGFRLGRQFTNIEIASIGVLSGLLNGSAGLPGPPVIIAQLVTPNTEKMVRSNLIIFFTILALFGIASIISGGNLHKPHVYLMATSAPFLVMGTLLGIKLFQNPTLFPHYRRISTYLLLIIGILKFLEVAL
jgi:hypothetical protein